MRILLTCLLLLTSILPTTSTANGCEAHNFLDGPCLEGQAFGTAEDAILAARTTPELTTYWEDSTGIMYAFFVELPYENRGLNDALYSVNFDCIPVQVTLVEENEDVVLPDIGCMTTPLYSNTTVAEATLESSALPAN